jgi:hypothetical protein
VAIAYCNAIPCYPNLSRLGTEGWFTDLLKQVSPRNPSVADELRTADRTAQKQLARIYIVSLLYIVVLSNDVEVTQPPLER